MLEVGTGAIVGMVDLIPMCSAAILAGEGLVALAVACVGWFYWLRFREKREQDSLERQRERIRREYWRQW